MDEIGHDGEAHWLTIAFGQRRASVTAVHYSDSLVRGMFGLGHIDTTSTRLQIGGWVLSSTEKHVSFLCVYAHALGLGVR